MSDTLSHIRRVNRYIKSQERKDLKKRMNPYNRLSSDKGTPLPYDQESARTTQDVITETLELARSMNRGNKTREAKNDKTDKLFKEASIVSPEIREAWHCKINLASNIDSDTRDKLIQMCNNPRIKEEPEYIREMRLNNLAKAWVNVWIMAKLDLVNQDRVPE